MGIGRLRHRVNVYEVQQGQGDTMGGYDTTKVLAGTFWATVTELDGNRQPESQASYTRSLVEIKMRTGAYAVTAKNIVEWEGIEYTIHSITTDVKKRFTILQAWA